MLRRSLIALACAMASGSALAQSSVTLYGVADAYIEYTNHNLGTGRDGHSKVALNSGGMSPSRWGLRGVEDLGSGKRAIFALESGFGLDNGVSLQGGRLFGRQAWVGLAAENQQITLGRQYTSLFLALANYVPAAYATLYEPVVAITGLSSRGDNMIKYRGVFGGLTTEVHWSFGEQPGTMNGGAGYGAGLDYQAGKFGISTSYDDINTARSATASYTRTQKAAVGLRYQITPQMLAQAVYRYNKNDTPTVNTAARDDLWIIGVNYSPIQPVTLTAAFYYDNVKSQYTAAGKVNPANPWQVTLIADYALSKRTDVYLATAFTKNAALNFENLNGAAAAYQLAPNEKNQFGAGIGMRHKF